MGHSDMIILDMRLKQSQLKGLSEFMNTVAAAWFSTGIISPFFIRIEDITRVAILAMFSLTSAGIFLLISIRLLKGVKS